MRIDESTIIVLVCFTNFQHSYLKSLTTHVHESHKCCGVYTFSVWEAKSIVGLCKNEAGHFPGLMLWAAGESFCVFCIMQ